ncbi:MAG: DMT family transporter [Bacteroidales bacterium]
MENDHRKGLIYAIFTASLWGFMAIILKIMTYELPSVTVVWFRFFTAFLVLSIWTLIFRRKDFQIFRRPPALLFLAAIFLGFNYLGFISGIKHISPSSSQVFIQVGPVGFALSGILIFREHVNWKHVVGFILVLSGIVLFYSEQLRELTSSSGHFTLGMFFVLGGGLSWAIFATIQKKLVSQMEANQLNLFIYAFCSAALLPLARFNLLPGMLPVHWMLLFYLGMNTVLAYGSLALAIKYTEATRVSVIITLNPIITFVTMALLTRLEVPWIEPESFSLLSIFGALTVLGGAILVISAGRKRRKLHLQSAGHSSMNS